MEIHGNVASCARKVERNSHLCAECPPHIWCATWVELQQKLRQDDRRLLIMEGQIPSIKAQDAT